MLVLLFGIGTTVAQTPGASPRQVLQDLVNLLSQKAQDVRTAYQSYSAALEASAQVACP